MINHICCYLPNKNSPWGNELMQKINIHWQGIWQSYTLEKRKVKFIRQPDFRAMTFLTFWSLPSDWNALLLNSSFMIRKEKSNIRDYNTIKKVFDTKEKRSIWIWVMAKENMAQNSIFDVFHEFHEIHHKEKWLVISLRLKNKRLKIYLFFFIFGYFSSCLDDRVSIWLNILWFKKRW